MKKKVYKFDWADDKDRFEASVDFNSESSESEKLMVKKIQLLIMNYGGLKKQKNWILFLLLLAIVICGFTISAILLVNL